MKYTLLVGIFCIARVHSQLASSPNVSSKCMYQVKGPKIQFLTPGVASCGDGPFYNSMTNELTYVDRKDITRFKYDFKTGNFSHKYCNTTEGKQLAFAYPAKISIVTVVGAGNQVQVEMSGRLSGAEVLTKETGYVINKGHADNLGMLFVSINSQYDKKHRGGKLYQLKNRKPNLVHESEKDIGDFAWSYDYTKFYVVTGDGHNITQFNYKNQTLSDKKMIFRMPPTFIKQEKITGIETDIKGCIWATVTGGYLLKISQMNGLWNIKKTTRLPLCDPTGVTFGGHKCNALIITTSKKCASQFREYNAGATLYISKLNTTGHCDNLISG